MCGEPLTEFPFWNVEFEAPVCQEVESAWEYWPLTEAALGWRCGRRLLGSGCGQG